MSDKSTMLRAFNSHFFEFLDDIITIVPDQKQLSASKSSFEMIKMGSPTAIIKAWHKFIVVPYEKVIADGDISFFFEKDYRDDLSHLKNSDSIMSIIDTIREPIKRMGSANHQHTMKYIQNLSKLSTIYADM